LTKRDTTTELVLEAVGLYDRAADAFLACNFAEAAGLLHEAREVVVRLQRSVINRSAIASRSALLNVIPGAVELRHLDEGRVA
jgi:dihydroxyacid dehydratase/phosphogluconate dehydratase